MWNIWSGSSKFLKAKKHVRISQCTPIFLVAGCDGGNSCCTPSNKCNEGEGDCDDDADCLDGYCGTDNCHGSGFGNWDDCCISKPLTFCLPQRDGIRKSCFSGWLVQAFSLYGRTQTALVLNRRDNCWQNLERKKMINISLSFTSITNINSRRVMKSALSNAASLICVSSTKHQLAVCSLIFPPLLWWIL